MLHRLDIVLLARGTNVLLGDRLLSGECTSDSTTAYCSEQNVVNDCPIGY